MVRVVRAFFHISRIGVRNVNHVGHVNPEMAPAASGQGDHPDRLLPDDGVWPPAWLRKTAESPRQAAPDSAPVPPPPPPPRPRPPALAAPLPAIVLPPPGARLFFSDADGRPCAPEGALLWTWEGAATWLYADRNPSPAAVIALRPDYPVRCPDCARHALRVAWQTFSNGTKHLRCECGVCGRFLAHLKKPPDNLDLEYRFVAGGA